LKVLQIYKDYYPPVKGGIEKHVNLLANGLHSRGVQVEVLVSNTRMKMESECFEGIQIYKAPQIGRFASAPLNITMSCWLRRLGERADILHFHFPNPTAELAYLISRLNKKYVVTYHSDIIRQVYLKILYAPFMHHFLRCADKIIATSPQYFKTSATLMKYKKKCEIIPLGIDLNQFNCNYDRLAVTSRIRKNHGTPIVLFVGKFRYYKGIHVLLQAMKKVNAKLLIVGADHSLETTVANQIEQVGLQGKIELLGELSDERLSDYLHSCDVFVLPSVQRSEAFGLVQLEAMACGKPVVCTELGTGTSYVNEHQRTGLVVPPNDPDALAKAINHLLHNPFICEQYGISGLSRVQNFFSLEKMIDRTEQLYRQVLN
jgi:glycosyltransferase involved in cell wall biosynthesis